MNRTTLPINEIVIEDRQRLDLGDLTDLQNSLKTYGLIQPIVVNQAKRLLAGGRRLACATRLGWNVIDVVYRETMSADEMFILELEENIQRKDETWQERCLHIAHIHTLKQKLASQDGTTWGQRETGAMLGESKTNVNYLLIIARKLRSELTPDGKSFLETARYAKCDSLASAWTLRLRDEEDANNAELARRHQEVVNQTPTQGTDDAIDSSIYQLANGETTSLQPTPLALEEIRRKYESNPLNKVPFEQYWAELEAKRKEIANTIQLSRQLYHTDSIEFMLKEENRGRFHHVVTDIPYGIDMAMLNQQNPHGGMKDIDTVEAEHEVEPNLKLIADFFPAAYACTQEKAFVVTFGDLMNWQFMYDSAIKAGFAVQRWPLLWTKEQAMNQCAQFNFTKDYEIAIVCRKKGSTLSQNPNTSVIHSGKDSLCDAIGHPFSKPFAAWNFIVSAVSLEGQLILEPFAGRGSGVISMLRLKRHVVACEINEAHYNALLENIKTYYLSLNPDFIFR